jgi:hypothetical protein
MKKMSQKQRAHNIATAKNRAQGKARRKITLRRSRDSLIVEKLLVKRQRVAMKALYDAGYNDQMISDLFNRQQRQSAEEKVRELDNSTHITPEFSEELESETVAEVEESGDPAESLSAAAAVAEELPVAAPGESKED